MKSVLVVTALATAASAIITDSGKVAVEPKTSDSLPQHECDKPEYLAKFENKRDCRYSTEQFSRLSQEACDNIGLSKEECYKKGTEELRKKKIEDGRGPSQALATEIVTKMTEAQAGEDVVTKARSHAETCNADDGKCKKIAYWQSLFAGLLCKEKNVNPSMNAKQCHDAAISRHSDWYSDSYSLAWYRIDRGEFAASIKNYNDAMQHAAKACANAKNGEEKACQEKKTALFPDAAKICRQLNFHGDRRCEELAMQVAEKENKAPEDILWYRVQGATAKQVYNQNPEILLQHVQQLKSVECSEPQGTKLSCSTLSDLVQEPKNDEKTIVKVCANYGGCSQCDASPLVTGLHVKGDGGLGGLRWSKRTLHKVDFTCELVKGETQSQGQDKLQPTQEESEPQRQEKKRPVNSDFAFLEN